MHKKWQPYRPCFHKGNQLWWLECITVLNLWFTWDEQCLCYKRSGETFIISGGKHRNRKICTLEHIFYRVNSVAFKPDDYSDQETDRRCNHPSLFISISEKQEQKHCEGPCVKTKSETRQIRGCWSQMAKCIYKYSSLYSRSSLAAEIARNYVNCIVEASGI